MQRDFQAVFRLHFRHEGLPRPEPRFAPKERGEAGVPAGIQVQGLATVGHALLGLLFHDRLGIAMQPVIPGALHVVELFPMDGRIETLGEPAAVFIQEEAEGIHRLSITAGERSGSA